MKRLQALGSAALGRIVRGREQAVSPAEFQKLRKRVRVLEEEVQECRRLNLRLAELTDVVTELLVPVARRDEARIAEVLERYTKGL